MALLTIAGLFVLAATPVGHGDHTRLLKVGDLDRTYLLHVPAKYDAETPTPVVLALHGALMNGPMMVPFCGLTKKSDEEGFIVVYPSATGFGPFLAWNAGGFGGTRPKERADDVGFIS
ncbi:MAG TPA: hypothetical protein VG713_22575, partial [Pirellulales bacterium]|nr:hypothetical protein [Pirellulales bacterium]